MANIAIGSFYKYRIYCYQGDQVGINTLYFQITNIAGGAPPTELAFTEEMGSLEQGYYTPALANNAQFIGVDIQNVTGAAPFPTQIADNSHTANGSGGATPLPAQVSGIYTIRTALTGPANRGRQYIPFPSTSFVLAGPPPTTTAAYQTLLESIADNHTGSVVIVVGAVNVTIEFQLARWGPANRTYTFKPTVDFFVGQLWATQRRRGDFGRQNPRPTP
jgi:hypothetical protein